MCWNSDISLNTFIFACLALVFIYLANTFTKYKSNLFDNNLVFLFFLAVAGMQLVEFFLWKNLNKPSTNRTLSIMGCLLVILQQTTLILLIPNAALRHAMLGVYALFVILYTLYAPVNYQAFVGKNGHLSWDWMNFKGYERIWLAVLMLFYILPLFAIKNKILMYFVFSLCAASFALYYTDNTFGTMWCWSTNLFLLYFIAEILIVKPYYDYNGLC